MSTFEKTKNRPLSRRIAWAALWAALFVFILFSGFAGWVFSYAKSPAAANENESVKILIPKGSSQKKIAEILDEKQLIKNDVRFFLLLKLMKSANTIRAGEFILSTGKTPVQVIEQLVHARPVQYSVTIAEGLTYRDIARLLGGKGYCNEETFLKLSEDKNYLSSLKIEGDTLEGYLFPDTYYFTRRYFSADALIKIMTKRFFAVWDRIKNNYPNRKMDMVEILTLASIVEKETGRKAERPVIAGVFVNRLKKKMKLQSDPTVIYPPDNFTGSITKKDLRRDTPYNTYIHAGLPPGPICNPGKKALMAVVEPSRHGYYYFVADNKGGHIFSKTLREHNRAVYQYRQARMQNKPVSKQKVKK